MLLADRRIELDARPAAVGAAPLEVVMLGHCPPEGAARWDRVARDATMLDEIAALGFTGEVKRLRAWQRGEPAPPAPDDGPSDEALKALLGLPLPIRSLGHFQTLFPGAADAACQRSSRLGGDRAWLPRAVQDFFAGHDAGFDDTRTLWVIRVPEADGVRAFLPEARPDWARPASLGAFDRALLVPRAGLVVLPDLERLLVPAQLDDVPRLRLPNVEPVFLPLGTATDDGHRERRLPREMPGPDESSAPGAVLVPILRALARRRPDMLALLSVPLAAVKPGELPAPSPEWLALGDADGAAAASLGDALRRVQLLYPYLRDRERDLVGASGLVAGAQARVAQRHGPWRSVAGRPLPGLAQAWPPVSVQQAAAWRERGLSVLQQRAGRLLLDDESLPAPVLPQADLDGMARVERERADWRSAEVQRFIGWVRRELQALGERLLFDVDPLDPRPEHALRSFFAQLHAAGALRGARPEQAFRIRPLPIGQSPQSTLAYEIELAPAFPVDLIRLTFVHERAEGLPRIEAALASEVEDG